MKRLVIIGGSSALLLLGIIFGAFFAGPLLASANTKPSATPNTADAKHPYCEQYQQDLAKRLGVSESTLQQDRQGALADVLAQAVKDGKITQSQADQIKQRTAKHAECAGLNLRGPRIQQLLKKYRADIIASLAQGLHLSSDQLTDQLQSGKSLNEIAKAQNVTTAQLHALVINTLDTVLKKAVSAGDLTQKQADTLNNFVQKHPNLLNRALNHRAKQDSK